MGQLIINGLDGVYKFYQIGGAAAASECVTCFPPHVVCDRMLSQLEHLNIRVDSGEKPHNGTLSTIQQECPGGRLD